MTLKRALLGVVTKASLALGNVDNTSDADKPVSTATQAALDAKQPLDSDLTAIAAIAPSNDDFVQRKSGAWTACTPTQVKSDLGVGSLFTPADHAFLAWTGDPLWFTGNGVPVGGAGVVQGVRIRLPLDASVTNIHMHVNTAGNTLTAGQCFASLHKRSDNTLVGQTADQATAWATGGFKTMALSGGPYSLSAGDYYVTFWFNGTTGPAMVRTSTPSGNFANANLASNDRGFTTGTGVTTTAPATLGAKTRDLSIWWAALS